MKASDKKVVKNLVQCLPYEYTEEGIRLKGEAYFVEYQLDQLRLMRLKDADSEDHTAEHWLHHFGSQEMFDRFTKLARESRKLASKYEALRDEVREHGIPEDIRTSWTPRLPEWPASIMWG